jgi:hypothetical protein
LVVTIAGTSAGITLAIDSEQTKPGDEKILFVRKQKQTFCEKRGISQFNARVEIYKINSLTRRKTQT